MGRLRLVVVPENPNFIIHVNRTIRPVYPDWVKRLLHPEFECIGPTRFDLSKIDRALNLQDGLAIKEKGEKVFLDLFGARAVFLFMSIVQSRFGGLYVPTLVYNEGRVVRDWFHVYKDWGAICPDAHFVRYKSRI